MKKCPRCLIEKQLEEFSNNKNRKDGKSFFCRQCSKEYKELKISKQQQTQYNKNYYLKNKEEIIKQKRQYQEQNKEKIKEWNKSWKKKNPDKVKANQKKARSKISFKRWRRKYEKNKRRGSPEYKLRHYFSNRIREAMKKSSSFKESSYLEHLPYTLEQLIKHLEGQFDDKMNWKNHGSYWHIDHIIPQKALPYSSFEDENFKKCWALENLRPLEKIENLKKGSKILNEENNVI